MIRLVIFDMDGVIFEGRNFWLGLHRAMGTEQEAWQLWREFSETDYAYLSRYTVEQLWRHKPVDHYWRLIHTRRPVAGIGEVFAYLRKHAIKSAIVSSGPYHLAERAQDIFGIDLIRANRIDIDRNGAFSGKIDVQVDENGKDTVAKEIMERLDLSPAVTAMVGDSGGDAAIAKLVALAIAYDTEDERLLESCSVHLPRGRICDLIPLFDNFQTSF